MASKAENTVHITDITSPRNTLMQHPGEISKIIPPHEQAGNAVQQHTVSFDTRMGALYTVTPPPIENLVFEGGGGKGVVYVGALRALEENGMLSHVRRTGGTSAGGITATLIALGYSYAECEKVAGSIKQNTLLDNPRFFGRNGLMSGQHLLNYFRELIRNRFVEILEKHGDPQSLACYAMKRKMADKTAGITFDDLKTLSELCAGANCKELFITGANITDSDHPVLDIFSRDTTPDMEIALALRITASLPRFYETVQYDGKIYQDGGTIDNYPMKIFDGEEYAPDSNLFPVASTVAQLENAAGGPPHRANLATLGFAVSGTPELHDFWNKKHTFSELSLFHRVITQLVNMRNDWFARVPYTQFLQDEHEKKQSLYAQRTIPIFDENTSTLAFSHSPEITEKLTGSGYAAASNWMQIHQGEQILVAAGENMAQMIRKMPVEDCEKFLSALQSGLLKVQLPPGIEETEKFSAEGLLIQMRETAETYLASMQSANDAIYMPAIRMGNG